MSKILSEDKIDIYMKMAHNVKEMSPDVETKVGALMLSKNKRIVASSFNGFLRDAPDDSLPNTRPDKYEFIQHAERNMIYNCSYEGIKTRDTIVICTLSPCLECVRAMYQSGIQFVIFDELYRKFDSSDMYGKLPDLQVSIEKIGKYTQLFMRGKKSWKESMDWIEKINKKRG